MKESVNSLFCFGKDLAQIDNVSLVSNMVIRMRPEGTISVGCEQASFQNIHINSTKNQYYTIATGVMQRPPLYIMADLYLWV